MNDSPSVLIVDDSRFARLFLREIVLSMGHSPLEAENGREGLELFIAENPDLILTDLEMPEMDGLAFIRELRILSPRTPVIVISGKSTYPEIIEAIRSGAWDYLVKPFSEEELKSIICGSLERARLIDESFRYRRRLEERVENQTKELHEGKERYRRLLESVTNYGYSVFLSENGNTRTVHHPGCVKITGYSPEEYAADPDLWFRIVYGHDRPQVLDLNRRILSEPAALEIEHRIVHKDGSIRWIRNTLVPHRNNDGLLLSYDGLITDITERKEAEAKMRESERKFKTLFESRPDGLLVADIHSKRFILSNQSMRAMLDYTEEELRQLTVRDIHPADALPGVMEHFELQVRGETDLATDLPVLRRDGSIFYADISASHIQLGGKSLLFGCFRDVTDRKLAQEKLQRHTDNLTALRSIDNAINSSLDLNVTLSVLLMEALKQLNVDAGVVLLLNPSTQTLDYVSGQGFHTDHIHLACVRMGEYCGGRVAKERRTLILNDFSIAAEGTYLRKLIDSEDFKAYVGVPLIAKGAVKGVLGLLHRSPLHPDQDWLMFSEALAGQAAIAIDNSEMFENLQNSHTELLLAYDTTIEGWARALDYRDRETEGHSRRVTELTVRIARKMGLGSEKLIHVRRGALLHDIGKLGVPDSILLKPGKLTDEEFAIMKRHPEIAFRLISPIKFLRPTLEIPYYHHERWDGSGYPKGLKGKEIPLTARIFAVVDVWDALSSNRPYRAAWPEERVREYLRQQEGREFDPAVVELFMDLIAEGDG